MATAKTASAADIGRLEAQVTAGQRIAGEEESDADRTLGRRVLGGQLSADEAIAQRLAQIDAAHGSAR